MAITGATPNFSNFGSWTENGWRVGPEPVPIDTRASQALRYGYGAPLSPIFSYTIIPPTINNGGIVAGSLSTQVGFMGMNTVTTYADVIPYYTSPYVPYGLDPTDLPTQTLGGGYLALQFQYPCQLEVVVEDCEVGPGQVTIFGYDWYLQPIQENVPIDNNGEDPATITVNTSRAFYGVTGVYVGQACPAGSGAMTISTTSNYGLPYTLWSKTCVTSISMYDGDTRYTPTFQKGDPLSVHNEPRGIVSWPTVGGPPDPDGAHYLDITYVLQGATPWNKMMEQIAGGANPARTAWTFPEGISGIPPFSADALIGVKPFYVGGYDNY